MLSSISHVHLTSLLLRLGLAFVFSFAAISSLISPSDWIGYLPKFATSMVPGETLLTIMSVYELVLAGWLVIGRQTRYAAALSALTLAGITVANLSLIAISFRDIGLVFSALALVVLSWPETKKEPAQAP